MPGMLRVSVFILGCLCSVVPLGAADIEGTVRATKNAPISDATIQVLRQQFVIMERRTGSDGRFDFHNLMNGSYVVRVRAHGYKERDVEVLLLLPESRDVLEIELKSVVEDAPIPPAGAVSAVVLKIPSAAKSDYEKGLEERRRGQCAKAIPRFQKAIAAFEKYGDAHNELANCFKDVGELSRAEESFKKAIQYTATIYPSLNLADLYSGQKRYAESEEVLRKSLDLHPSEGDLHFGLAKLHFDQGQMKQALDAGLRAHQMNHRMADVHLLLGKVYLNLGDRNSVTVQLQLYLDENPKGPTADLVRKTLANILATNPR
jgi:tetratricopeptide (TPR) repeat protein